MKHKKQKHKKKQHDVSNYYIHVCKNKKDECRRSTGIFAIKLFTILPLYNGTEKLTFNYTIIISEYISNSIVKLILVNIV